MKRLTVLLLTAVCLICVCSCGVGESSIQSENSGAVTEETNASEMYTDDNIENNIENNTDNIEDNGTSGETSDNASHEVRINMIVSGKTIDGSTVDSREAIVELLDNDAAADFLSMLPMTLTFEDYSGIEKISNLPRKLQLGAAPTSCDPNIGTFAYYEPWGNLSVFYQDFRISNNLVPLGTFVSGIEIFAEMDGDFSVRIEMEDMT